MCVAHYRWKRGVKSRAGLIPFGEWTDDEVKADPRRDGTRTG
jgi:hypothetical protein